MRDYEIVYIFKSSFMPEEIEQKLEKYHGVLTGDGGEITAVEQWGKRQLAYPIRKESNAYYVIAQFTVQPAALPEFERRLKLDEDLLRHLIVISEGELPRPAASLEHAEGRTKAPTESADADKGAESADADKGAESADAEPAAAESDSESDGADSESEESAPAADESAADETEKDETEEVAAEGDSAADVEELAEGETADEPIAEVEEEVAPADDDAEVEPAGDEEKES